MSMVHVGVGFISGVMVGVEMLDKGVVFDIIIIRIVIDWS